MKSPTILIYHSDVSAPEGFFGKFESKILSKSRRQRQEDGNLKNSLTSEFKERVRDFGSV